MNTFTLKDRGDVSAVRIQLRKDGFELVETFDDGSGDMTEVYHQTNPQKVKVWSAMDQYKETKARIKAHYDYGISAYKGRGFNYGSKLTDWHAV